MCFVLEPLLALCNCTQHTISAVRKAKFFLHPDKIPKDLTESQTLLFKTIWHTIQEGIEASISD